MFVFVWNLNVWWFNFKGFCWSMLW
jgi:hypothetical protein